MFFDEITNQNLLVVKIALTHILISGSFKKDFHQIIFFNKKFKTKLTTCDINMYLKYELLTGKSKQKVVIYEFPQPK